MKTVPKEREREEGNRMDEREKERREVVRGLCEAKRERERVVGLVGSRFLVSSFSPSSSPYNSRLPCLERCGAG